MIGGTMETLALMPLITYKFCKQEGRPYPKFPGMYRGVAIQAGNVAPVTALQLFFNGLFESGLKSINKREINSMEVVGCALSAGAASAILYGPVDLTMIHQQKLSLNVMQTVRHLSKLYGPFAIFRGLPCTAVREALYTSGYVALAPLITTKIMTYPQWQDQYFLSSLTGAIIAGVIANGCSHPIDTIKTVQQADMTKQKYSNSFQTLNKLIREGGVKSLFKGGLARTIRGCGAFFIVSSFREICIQNKTNNNSPWKFKL